MPSSDSLHQPTQRVPLDPVAYDRTEVLDVIGLRCRLRLHVEVEDKRTPVSFPFVVDSGASYSLISLELAISLQLRVPHAETEIELEARTARGVTKMRVRPGRIRAWWNEELPGYPFDWPVLLQVDAPPDAPAILGLGGVAKTCRWTFDGAHSHESPHGFLQLDDIR